MLGTASPNTSGTKLAIFSVLLLITIAGLDLAYLLMHWGDVGQLGSYWWGMQDFRDAIYYPCSAIRSGINPYDVATYQEHFKDRIVSSFPLYSPLVLLLYYPLAYLPYHAAGWVFQAANFLFLLTGCSAVLRWCGWKIEVATVCTLAGLVLLSEPGRSNVIFGQVAWPLVLATYAALCLAGLRPAWSGLALGLMSFKPTYWVATVFFMCWRGDFRALGHGFIWTAVGTCAGLGLMAAQGVDVLEIPSVAAANYQATLADSTVQPRTALSRVDVPVFLGKAFYLADNAWLMQVAPLAVMLITGFLVMLEVRSPENRAPDSFAMSLICLGSLVGIYHHVYDLVLLVLPVVAMFTGTHPSWKKLSSVGRRLLQAGAVLLALNVFWTGAGVRVVKAATAFWPELFQPWWETGWQIALLINPTVLLAMWAVAIWMSASSLRSQMLQARLSYLFTLVPISSGLAVGSR